MKPPLFSSPSSSSSSSINLRKPRQLSPYLFSLLIFIVFVAILYGQDLACVFSRELNFAAAPDRPIAAAETGQSTRIDDWREKKNLTLILLFSISFRRRLQRGGRERIGNCRSRRRRATRGATCSADGGSETRRGLCTRNRSVRTFSLS